MSVKIAIYGKVFEFSLDKDEWRGPSPEIQNFLNAEFRDKASASGADPNRELSAYEIAVAQFSTNLEVVELPQELPIPEGVSPDEILLH